MEQLVSVSELGGALKIIENHLQSEISSFALALPTAPI